LNYVTNVSPEGFEEVEGRYEEFINKFRTPGDGNNKYEKALMLYFIALDDAIDEAESIRSSLVDKAGSQEFPEKIRKVHSADLGDLVEGGEVIKFLWDDSAYPSNLQVVHPE